MSCSRTTIEPPAAMEQQPHTITSVDSLHWVTTATAGFNDIVSYGFAIEEDLLENILVDIGDSVSVGDTLAILQHSHLSAQIRTQNTVIASVQREHDRIVQLHTQQARTEVQREQSESILQIERAKRSELVAQLKRYYLLSKTDGVVIGTDFEDGQFAPVGSTVVEVARGKQMFCCRFPFDFDSTSSVVELLDGRSFYSQLFSHGGLARISIESDSIYQLDRSCVIQFTVPSPDNIALITLGNRLDIEVNDILKITTSDDRLIMLEVIQVEGAELTVLGGGVSTIDGEVALKSVVVVQN